MNTYILDSIVNYIEENLTNNISLDDIAKEFFISKYYLLHAFKGITGMGIHEYIKKRRMSLSIKDLISTDQQITFIANKYNMNVESYIKSFKQMSEVSPLKYRKNPFDIEIYEKFNTQLVIDLKHGMLVKPTTKLVTAFNLYGYKLRIHTPDNVMNSTAIKAAIDFERKVKNLKEYIGLSYFTDNSAEYFNYYTAARIRYLEDMEEVSIPTNCYAVFKYIGLHALEDLKVTDLVELRVDAFKHWFPTASITNIINYYYFEQVDLSKCSEDYCELYLYCPIDNELAKQLI